MKKYNFAGDPETRPLPDVWYEQLEDPPEPPPRDSYVTIEVDLTDHKPIKQPIQSPFPSDEGLEEAPESSSSSI